MTPFKNFLLNNEYAYVCLKLLSIIGCVSCLGVIAVLSLEAVEKFRGMK